ncbi:undecaprenyldiphospho-muramoylpentapeptide beta-N-acetylglucosaminyltransferase [Ruegeria denitrificans]|uniref:Undecaprenyldiphospho-muramoylpentapeptide beta-N-acetylglucosaminyltransferase n=1 Tax=Ruegeria denitrificans TaxID=1715692 RepID=A0A0P1IPL8_9RHOB|nr:glycosyltransferase [Ruegeria denitrificans]CUJ93266.1 undecaprenyldiphospho-muramoylpentapeptide beta-N-acetylglucosaminyltransferase [Ruegeria denitrificans]
MIFIEAGTRSLRSFDAQLIFAEQLAARGFNVCIDAEYLPNDAGRGRVYDAAKFLVDPGEHVVEIVFVIGADEIDDHLLASLRQKQLAVDVPVIATGRFEAQQSYIAAKSRLAYALGREATVLDLTDFQPRSMLPTAACPLVADIRTTSRSAGKKSNVAVVLGSMELEDTETLSCLSRMSNQSVYNLRLIVSGAQNEAIRTSPFHDLPTCLYTDLSSLILATSTDVLVMFGHGVAGVRMAAFAVELMAAGGIAIDCTDDEAIVSSGAPALIGPKSLLALDGYLTGKILGNIARVAEQAAKSQWLNSVDISRLETAAGLKPTKPEPVRTEQRTLFYPTNGVGLGHAQRCAIIAKALPDDITPIFAAFPSCVPLVRREGMDCIPLVQRTEISDRFNGNDVLTYRRLGATLQENDRLVFDGGYVFDSVYRLILERNLSAVWVRRGLWPDGRSRPRMLEREGVFDRVIVPSEAFEELNDTYSFGDNIHTVGPIFRKAALTEDERDGLRARLAERFGRDFDHLVVSMLGGGVASDRSAQLQAICGMLEDRADCLHLVVTWPGSTVQPATFGWKNTRVVQTFEATKLCLAADVVISAAGYNSVLEILYNKIPAILIPQSAPYLDNQERRARALADRDLCALITEKEFMKLERTVSDCLDQGELEIYRSALNKIDLPEPGAAKAAEIIAEAQYQK